MAKKKKLMYDATTGQFSTDEGSKKNTSTLMYDATSGTFSNYETPNQEIKSVEPTIQQVEPTIETREESKIEPIKTFDFSADEGKSQQTTQNQQKNTKKISLTDEDLKKINFLRNFEGKESLKRTDLTEEELKGIEALQKINENNKSPLYDITNTGVMLGKGIFHGAERIYDAALQAGSSKYNPGMYLADDTRSIGDKALDFVKVLAGDFLNVMTPGNVGDVLVNSAYNENKSAIDSKQVIARELIEDTPSDTFLNETLGYGKVLDNGKTIQETLDENASLIKSTNFGGKLMESIGNQLPSMIFGAGSGEAAALIPMAIESYGAGVEEAYKNGATREEADRYGLMNATIEVATEKMFAGVGGLIGKGALDDVVKNALTSKIKNKVANYMVNYGLDMLGEGVEEVLADVFNPIAKKLSYASEEDLMKLYEDENFLEDFLMGTFSAAVMKSTSIPFEVSNINQQSNIQTQPNQVQNLPTQEVLQENNQTPIEQQTPQITPLNEVNQELQETRQSDIANQVQAMNLNKAEQTIKTNNLNEYLEDVATREAQQNQLDKESVRQILEDYIEENNLENPTKEDLMNAFDDYDAMDTAEDINDIRKAEQLYEEVADEIIQETNTPKDTINQDIRQEVRQEQQKQEVKQEKLEENVKKSLLTQQEQNELEGLRKIEEQGLAQEQELNRLKELERKEKGITIKYPELKTNNTFNDIKQAYYKYNNEISTENKKILNKAKSVIEANKQGRRTIEQWKQVAEFIGSNANIKNVQDLQRLAIETWFETRPNTAQNLNRQGKKYVPFAVQDWVNAVYKGAGVGQEINNNKTQENKITKQPKKETINETKQDNVIKVKDNNKTIELKPKKDGIYENITKTDDIFPANKEFKVGDKNVSNFYSNITEKSKFITLENRIKMMDNDNLHYYDAITNKETLQNAMDNLNKNTENAVGDFLTKEKFTPTDVATGWILVKRYQDAGNFDMMSKVIEKMRDQGTKAGQTVQMYGILQRLTPEGMEYYAQKQLDNAYNEYSKNKSKKQIEKYAKDFTLTAEEHQFIKDTMEKVQQLTDEEAKKVEIAKIVRMLSDKLPPTKGSRIKAWMRVSMLGNPKTQVRNIMGNAIIQPINWLGDIAGTIADKAISKKTNQRTLGLTNLKEIRKGRNQGFKDTIRDIKTGVDTRDINLNRFEDSISAKPFYEHHEGKGAKILNKTAKVLNKANKIVGDVMSGGDRIFYQAIYNNSLQNQMKLNKVTTPTQEMIDIATQEALSRTWNDSNNYTKAVLQIRHAMNKLNVKGYGLGDVLIPFAKTPANLTKAIVDYSPLGLARTILQDGRNLKNSLENGQYSAQLQHKFADSLGKGFAGSLLYVAAYALAQAGIITGKNDDDKDVANFMKNTLGIQPYSVKIGDKSFTYDWAQPIAAPFAIMADVKKMTEKENQELDDIITSSINSASNILLEQSFLSSIQDVFNSYEGPIAAITKQIQDLPARATPTFFKQVADLIDPTSRQTYVKGDNLETAKNKVQVKLPGASTNLTSQRDTLGRELEKYGGDENKLQYAFNVFLNPANTTKGKVSEAAEEIYKVYQATGDKTIMPRQVGYSENVGGKTRNLTAEERNEWQKISGELVEENVKALVDSAKYKKMSNEDKADVINKIVNYSYNKAKSEVFDTPMSNTYKAADRQYELGFSIADYYVNKVYNSK